MPCIMYISNLHKISIDTYIRVGIFIITQFLSPPVTYNHQGSISFRRSQFTLFAGLFLNFYAGVKLRQVCRGTDNGPPLNFNLLNPARGHH